MLEAIRALVEIESPSRDREGLARARSWVQARLRALEVPSEEEPGGGGALGFRAELAQRARAALILEPALGPQGAVKTARKGVGRFKLTVRGKAAHAGLDPDSGASAIHELAVQVTRVAALADAAKGTTLNVGKIE